MVQDLNGVEWRLGSDVKEKQWERDAAATAAVVAVVAVGWGYKTKLSEVEHLNDKWVIILELADGIRFVATVYLNFGCASVRAAINAAPAHADEFLCGVARFVVCDTHVFGLSSPPAYDRSRGRLLVPLIWYHVAIWSFRPFYPRVENLQ